MPTYDYVCLACGRSFEVVHGIHATRPTVCEVCGGELKKALSTPAIVFKGSGWAKKDARTASASGGSSAATGGRRRHHQGSRSGIGRCLAIAPAAEKASGETAAPATEAPRPATSSTPAKGAAGGSVGTSG